MKGSNSSNDVSASVVEASSAPNQSSSPIHLVLRMRDEKRELQDIKFDFLPNKDTVDEISHELVNAKLIDAIDMIVVSSNLTKLLQNPAISPITFSLVKYLIWWVLFLVRSFTDLKLWIIFRNRELVRTKCQMKRP